MAIGCRALLAQYDIDDALCAAILPHDSCQTFNSIGCRYRCQDKNTPNGTDRSYTCLPYVNNTLGAVHKFVSSILVIRDPTKSTFSEYTRGKSKGHVGRIKSRAFNRARFETDAIKKFAKTVRNSCTHMFPRIEELVGVENVLYIRFEDMLVPGTRQDKLKRIAEFLTNDPIPDGALANAFEHSERFHRPKVSNGKQGIQFNSSSGGKRRRRDADLHHRPPAQQQQQQPGKFVRFEDAFTPELLAKFWLAVGCGSCGYAPDSAAIEAWKVGSKTSQVQQEALDDTSACSSERSHFSSTRYK